MNSAQFRHNLQSVRVIPADVRIDTLLARARAVMLTNYHAVARYVGLDPYVMLRQAELHPSALADAENWIPAGRALNLLEECAFQSARDDFGVLLGECRTFGSLGPVSLLLKHESNLGAVIGAAVDYRKLLNELLELRLEDDGRSSVLEWSLIPGLRSSQGINLLATIGYRVLVDGSGCNWQPDCIHFRQAEPAYLSTFKRIFRCSLEFDSAFDGMSFASTCLELRNEFADLELARHARRLLDLMPAVRRDDTMTQRVTATIALLMSNGQADVETVAQCVGVPVRTLQRRLISEGQSFSNLLAETRRDLAVRYLSSSKQSITAVAQLTGYSALSSFTRWFASEFGMSPKKWRQLMVKRDVPAAESTEFEYREPRPTHAIEAL